jgi:hypothetical protein
MKQPIAIAFLIVYSILLLKPVIPIINYYIQLEAYKTHCVNKQQPELKCEGTCHLQSEIKQQSEKEPVLPIVKSGIEDSAFCFITTVLSLVNSSNYITPSFPTLSYQECQGFFGAAFHPPDAVPMI